MQSIFHRRLRASQRKRDFAIITLLLLIIGGSLAYGVWQARLLFKIKDIYVYGNQHLKVEEIRGLSGVKRGDQLFGHSLKDISNRLRTNPWIKDVKIRRELTGKLHILIREAVPTAILRLKGHNYLVDTDGVLLEDIGDTKTFFLPVILEMDPVKNKPVYQEAIRFIQYITNKGSHLSKGGLEVLGKRPEDLSVRMDNVLIIVGAGDYDKKLERLEFVRGEILKRNITVSAIDLRFANKIIVKPSADEF